MSPDKAVDNMMYEFFNNRLPPYAKDIKKGKNTTFKLTCKCTKQAANTVNLAE